MPDCLCACQHGSRRLYLDSGFHLVNVEEKLISLSFLHLPVLSTCLTIQNKCLYRTGERILFFLFSEPRIISDTGTLQQRRGGREGICDRYNLLGWMHVSSFHPYMGALNKEAVFGVWCFAVFKDHVYVQMFLPTLRHHQLSARDTLPFPFLR